MTKYRFEWEIFKFLPFIWFLGQLSCSCLAHVVQPINIDRRFHWEFISGLLNTAAYRTELRALLCCVNPSLYHCQIGNNSCNISKWYSYNDNEGTDLPGIGLGSSSDGALTAGGCRHRFMNSAATYRYTFCRLHSYILSILTEAYF